MSDTAIPEGSRNQGADFTATAVGSAIPKLACLAPDGEDGVQLCPNVTTPMVVSGFALNAAAEGGHVQVKSTGVIVGTPEEWNAVSDEDNGLRPGPYFASATPGKISQSRAGTRPAIGVAVGKTTLILGTPLYYNSGD